VLFCEIQALPEMLRGTPMLDPAEYGPASTPAIVMVCAAAEPIKLMIINKKQHVLLMTSGMYLFFTDRLAIKYIPFYVKRILVVAFVE
jgi:hypothetical protein